MVQSNIEERLSRLETRVAEIQAELRAGGGKDWRRTIGVFTDDPGMQELLQEAMRLREEDRKKARRSRNPRKPRR